MNKRVEKKVKKDQRQDIHKILDQVLDINGLGARKRSLTGELPTAFFTFSGHVAEVEVSIHGRGWDHGHHGREFQAYTDDPDSLEQMLEEIKRYVSKKAETPAGGAARES